MGVDYTTSIGVGKQAKIDYQRFAYDKYDALEEELNYGASSETSALRVMLTSQEYKGTICHTTLFVGKLLPHTEHGDPQSTTAIRVADMVDDVRNTDMTPEELEELDRLCARLAETLDVGPFSTYGLHILVECC